jgi:heme-degrading monooxygenase HmoA
LRSFRAAKGSPMLVVIFEVEPRKERRDEYFTIARRLRPRLEAIDGFIENERFASRRTEARFLSLSAWRNEKALVRWRNHAEHRAAQERGRAEIFQNYRLRVGAVVADSDPAAGSSLNEERCDEKAKFVTVTELLPLADRKPEAELEALMQGLLTQSDRLLEYESFESIYRQGKLLLLADWRTAEGAMSWDPADGQLRHRKIRVIRDYGMFEREEAPRFPSQAESRA